MVSPAGKAVLAEIAVKRDAYASARKAAFGADGQPSNAANSTMRAAFQDYLASIDKLAEHQRKKSVAIAHELEQRSGFARRLVLVLCLIANAAAIASSTWVTRSVTGPLRRAMGVAQAVAQGRLRQHDERNALDETGQLLDALNQMNRDLYRIVGEVRDSSAAIASVSSEIASGNLDLSSRTEQQASALEETASAMEELTETVKQNTENTRQANQLAQTASKVAVQGGEVVEQVVATMKEVVTSVERVTAIMRDIALASHEQEAGLGQINQAISQMDAMTQQNAALVEEASAASEAMRVQAQHMETVVGVFELEGAASTGRALALA